LYSQIGKKWKRRVKQKTNYLKRLALLKGNKPRIVIRKTNKYINVQYIIHNSKGDLSKINISSKILKNLFSVRVSK